jgi:glycosyltransferase involved in cell wall biosynthesis
VHHSLHIHAPFLLRHLATPTLYFVEEPRRRSFEALAVRSPHATVPAPLAGPAWALERFLRHADSKSTSRATAIAANSAFTAEAVLRAYGRSAWVCHLGVDHEFFAPAARREDHLDHPPYVMAVGALDWIKGHELALDAVALMGAPRPRVVIVYERSAPGYAGVLQRRAQRSGVELELRRGISDHQLCQLYRGAMATLCLSRLEPFGLTALESLCTGTPVVALGEGGFRETVVDGRNGYVVEPEAQSVRDAIEAVRVGRLGADRSAVRRSVVPHFTLPAMVDRLESLLERTVTLARSGQGST